MKTPQLRQIIRESIKELYKKNTLKEQSTTTHYRMILRKCSHGTDGTPYSTVGNQTCNVYPYLVYNNSVSGNVPFQIGECFAWNHDIVGNGHGIVCVVDYTNQPVSSQATIHRDQHTCQDCGQDANNNGVSDCIDCDGITWNQRFKCHPVHGCVPCLGAPQCNNSIAFPFTSLPDCNSNCTLPVPGCTDPTALNYNPNATQDDGSCIFPVYGCMDQNACNFDSNADTDDGSCTYPGCIDSNATNFDPNAGCDDGSCNYPPPIEGCTDSNATNYNPNATLNDGSCEYGLDPDDNLSVVSANKCPSSHAFHNWPLGYLTNNDPMANITYPNQGSYCEWCADWRNGGSVPGTFDSRAWGYDESACDCCPPSSTLITKPPTGQPGTGQGGDEQDITDIVERFKKLANISKK